MHSYNITKMHNGTKTQYLWIL